MRKTIPPLVLSFCLLITGPAFGQDLGQLKERVSKMWEARARLNRTEVLKFIDAETQNAYLQLNEVPASSFKILAIEFTDNPSQVYVPVNVRGVAAGLAEMDRIVRDAWVWKD